MRKPSIRSPFLLAMAVVASLASSIALVPPVEAARPHGGSGVRATAPANVNRAPAANRSAHAGAQRSTSREVERSRSVNVDREVHVDVDVDDHGHGCCHNDYWDDHPVATAAAVTTAVAATSAVIGSIVNSVPPSCVQTIVNGVAYQQCGSTWYQPQYAGTTVQYVVVDQPN